MTPVRLEPVALRSRVKHSTTEPLRSLGDLLRLSLWCVEVVEVECDTGLDKQKFPEKKCNFFLTHQF